MPPAHETSVEGRRARDRRVWRYAFLVSLALHVVMLFLFRGFTPPLDPYAAAGPMHNDPDDSSGSVQLMQIAVQQPAKKVVSPDAKPIPVPEVIDLPELEVAVPTLEDGLSTLVMGSISLRPGTSTGTGEGDAGAGGGGTSRTVPPSPRGMIIPPTHDALRGAKTEVWVFVDERGRVVPDSTRLVPPTRDGKLNERLIREAADWRFSPALSLGQPIAAWFPYTITM